MWKNHRLHDPLSIALVIRSNRLCGKTNLSNPTVPDDVVNTNINNLNRTPSPTIRTYILHQVVYIILHLRHLIPRVNKVNKNTTQYEHSNNRYCTLKVNNIILIFSDETKAVTTDMISALKNLEDKLAVLPGNLILHDHFESELFSQTFFHGTSF